MKKLAAVIAYNEEESIGAVIDELREKAPDFDIVVIDNASTDMTVEVCRSKGVRCISHAVNTGSSFGTVQTYLQYGAAKNYDVVCQLDADGQHDPSYLAALAAPVLSGQAGLVIGSRFIEKVGFQSSLLRRVCITLYSFLLTKLLDQKISDFTSGFKAYGKDLVQSLARNYRREFYDNAQILALVHAAKFRILEVPVQMRPRLHGTSEFSATRSVIFMLKASLSVFCYLIRRTC